MEVRNVIQQFDSMLRRSGSKDADTIVAPHISTADVQKFLNNLKVDEVIQTSAMGTLSSGVYSSTVTVAFKDQRRKAPPKVLAFGGTMANGILSRSDMLPNYVMQYNPTLVGGFIDGYTCIEWSRADIYRTYVDIVTCSTAAYTKNYVIYVLSDRTDADRK